MFSAGNRLKEVFLFQGDKKDSLVIYGALFLLIFKLLLFPITQTVDADAVTRTFISYNWLKNPHFITDSVWAPLHFYLNGIIMWISGSFEDGPRYFNLFLSSLTIVPLYFFVKEEFSRQGAIYSAGLFALSPVIFRNSFQALSGTPYLFFLAIALFYFARALRNNRWSNYFLAGLMITVAAGFRYEAWIIIAVFTFIGLLRKRWKGTLLFWSFAMIIPIGWMLVGWIYHNDFFYGINGAYGWNIEKMGVNENVNDTERLKRLFFFPMSWFLAVSPVLAWVLIITFFKHVFQKKFSRIQFYWMLPLFVIWLAFLIKAQDGTLLLQHRFTGSLVFFSAPLIAMAINEKTRKVYSYLMTLALLLIIPQSYFWYAVNLDEWTPLSRQIKSIIKDIQLSTGPEMLPLPQIDNHVLTEGLDVLEGNFEDKDGLILDFFGWTETYYMALQYPASDPFVFPGAKHDHFPEDKFHNYIDSHPNGMLVLHCPSNHSVFVKVSSEFLCLEKSISPVLKLTLLKEIKGLLIYEYEVIDNSNDVLYDPSNQLNCFEIGSVEYFESMGYFNVQFREDAKRIMRKDDVLFENAMIIKAAEMHNKYELGEIEL